MNNRLLFVYLSALLLTSCAHKKNADIANVPEIDVAEAITDSVVIYNTYPGTLSADNTVDIVARVSGSVTSQNYKNGDKVSRGQLLFTIEDTKYRDALQQAEAQLATARSNHDYALAQYTAMKKALESDAVSLMEVNKAKSSVQQAEAAIKQAEAAISSARTNLGYCRVTAPCTGHASASTLSVGAFVNGEVSPVTLATIYEDAKLYAKFYIGDEAMQQVLKSRRESSALFDSIPIKLNESPDKQLKSRLTYIAPDVDTSTGTLAIRSEVDNTDGTLHDGMYATISFPLRVEPHATLVKDAAISSDQLGKFLYTVNDSNKIVYTPIKVGAMANDSMRIVSSGITPGTRYVTKALLKVRPDMTVRPHLVR